MLPIAGNEAGNPDEKGSTMRTNCRSLLNLVEAQAHMAAAGLGSPEWNVAGARRDAALRQMPWPQREAAIAIFGRLCAELGRQP